MQNKTVWKLLMILSVSVLTGCGIRIRVEDASEGAPVAVVPTETPQQLIALATQVNVANNLCSQIVISSPRIIDVNVPNNAPEFEGFTISIQAPPETDLQILGYGSEVLVNDKKVEYGQDFETYHGQIIPDSSPKVLDWISRTTREQIAVAVEENTDEIIHRYTFHLTSEGKETYCKPSFDVIHRVIDIANYP